MSRISSALTRTGGRSATSNGGRSEYKEFRSAFVANEKCLISAISNCALLRDEIIRHFTGIVQQSHFTPVAVMIACFDRKNNVVDAGQFRRITSAAFRSLKYVEMMPPACNGAGGFLDGQAIAFRPGRSPSKIVDAAVEARKQLSKKIRQSSHVPRFVIGRSWNATMQALAISLAGDIYLEAELWPAKSKAVRQRFHAAGIRPFREEADERVNESNPKIKPR